MLALIIGGSASGKSEFCENLAVRLGKKKLYIATMFPHGDEAKKRIERHIKMRSEKGFFSIDKYYDLKNTDIKTHYDVIMVECMSNLVANEMFSQNGNADRIYDGIISLYEKCDNLLIVSNDVSLDGDSYCDEVMEYIKNISLLNVRLAKKADTVIEVVASIPIYHKGRDFIEKLI